MNLLMKYFYARDDKLHCRCQKCPSSAEKSATNGFVVKCADEP